MILDKQLCNLLHLATLMLRRADAACVTTACVHRFIPVGVLLVTVTCHSRIYMSRMMHRASQPQLPRRGLESSIFRCFLQVKIPVPMFLDSRVFCWFLIIVLVDMWSTTSTQPGDAGRSVTGRGDIRPRACTGNRPDLADRSKN